MIFKSSITLKTKHKLKPGYKKNLKLLIMCLPAMVLFIMLRYIPMFGIIIAFKDFRFDKGFLGSSWVGFKNFEFFFKSNDAWRVLRNTIGMNLVFIVVGTSIAVFLALLLNEISNRRLIKTYQTIMFFPHFLSWVVVSYLLYSFLSVDMGIVNGLLSNLGHSKINWYMRPEFWPVILVFMHVWKGAGYSCILYYAGLMGIDTEYYEAAALDGASKIQMIKNISLPLLAPLISIIFILEIGKVLHSDFGIFFQLTRDSGALYPTTDVIDTYVYRALKVTGDTGMAAAVNLFQSVVGFFLVIATNMIVKRINEENSLY